MQESYKMQEPYDLAVIGAGPAGYTAALEAAKLGMRTVLVEKRELGGTCLNRGCIPTKTILHAAELFAQIQDAEKFGVFADNPSFDMGRMQTRKREVVQKLQDGISTQLKKSKVATVAGRAVIADAHTVRIFQQTGEAGQLSESVGLQAGETEQQADPHKGAEMETEIAQEFYAKNILIATGSEPALPPIPGTELADVLTSDALLEKTTAYPSLIIVGGGVIGMEFASIYSWLGCQVTVIEFLDRILANMDREISQNLKMILKKRGVDIHTGSRVARIEKGAGGRLLCHFLEKETEKEAVADGILIATGRKACTKGLFADDFGVTMERGQVIIDAYGRTSVENIYAAGDVAGGSMLAHAATAQAVNAVHHMAGAPMPFDTRYVPGCVYTDPEIASVGLTQDEAKRQSLDVIVKKYPMSANGKTVLSDQERGFIKVVADKETQKILGAQMMCARATDMISQFTAAIGNGLTLEQLGAVIYPHPTFSEAIGDAVR